MTVTELLQWPLRVVPLLFSGSDSVAEAVEVAKEIGKAGELRIEWWEQKTGRVRLGLKRQATAQAPNVVPYVYPNAKAKAPTVRSFWRVNIRPAHSPRESRPPDWSTVHYITLEFSPNPVTRRYPRDPSSYLTVVKVR